MPAITDVEILSMIEESPDDDLPRLLYADWLDEQESVRVECRKCIHTPGSIDAGYPGDLEECRTCHGTGTTIDTTNADRAELLRVQVELARLQCETPSIGAVIEGKPAPCYMCRPRKKRDCEPWCPSCCRRDDLLARESALLGDGSRWRKGPVCGKCYVQPVTMKRMGCVHCWHSADAGGLLRTGNMVNHWTNRVEWHRGFPRVFCRLEDVVELTPNADGSNEPVDWKPTPWAKAVITHHRGSELWVTDYKPYQLQNPDRRWCFRERDGANHPHLIPEFLFELIEAPDKSNSVRMVWYPTADLAHLALARALTRFVRNHEEQK